MTPPQMRREHLFAMFTIGMVAVIISACHSGKGKSPNETPLATVAMKLPLQAEAVVVGGDAQPDIVDLTSLSITEEQARKLADKCPRPLDIVQDKTCRELMLIILHGGPCDHGLCGVFSAVPGKTLVIRIIDERPGELLCAAGPGGLCFQTSVNQAAIPPEILARLPASTAVSTGMVSPSTPSSPETNGSSSPPTSGSTPVSSSDESPSVSLSPSATTPSSTPGQ